MISVILSVSVKVWSLSVPMMDVCLLCLSVAKEEGMFLVSLIKGCAGFVPVCLNASTTK